MRFLGALAAIAALMREGKAQGAAFIGESKGREHSGPSEVAHLSKKERKIRARIRHLSRRKRR